MLLEGRPPHIGAAYGMREEGEEGAEERVARACRFGGELIEGGCSQVGWGTWGPPLGIPHCSLVFGHHGWKLLTLGGL